MDARLASAIAALGAGPYVPGSSATQGWLYNPLPFPGCENVPCHRPNSGEKWKLVAKHTDFKDKRVLDFGCATGYFSFRAVQAGAAVVLGIDHDPAAVEVCQAAVEAFDVKNTVFLADSECHYDLFDVGFAMSVLNWMGRGCAEDFLAWSAWEVALLWVEMPLAGDGRRGAHWLASHEDTMTWLRRFRSDVKVVGFTRGPHEGKKRALIRCRM